MRKNISLLFLLFVLQSVARGQCVISIAPSGVIEICGKDSVLLSAPTGFASYLWSTGQTSNQIYATKSATYYLVAKTTNGCVAFDSVVVKKAALPQFTLAGSARCDSTKYIFTNTTNLVYTNVRYNFRWDFGDGESYVSDSNSNISADINKWTNPITHTYYKEGVFKPYLAIKNNILGCIDTFRFETTNEPLPENIKYKIDIVSNKIADSLCAQNATVTLVNKYKLHDNLSYAWNFNDYNGASPQYSIFNNVEQATYTYKKVGQYFPTLTVNCPFVSPLVYNYFTKIDTVPSSNLFNPPAQSIKSLNTINGKLLASNDSLFFKPLIYKNNVLTDSLTSKWAFFKKNNADTLNKIAVNKLYGYGINIVGLVAQIESADLSTVGKIPAFQKNQVGPIFPVQFTNVSSGYQTKGVSNLWDFDDRFGVGVTSFSVPNPSAANQGKPPYTDAADLQNRTIGVFTANGNTYLGRITNQRFSLDTLPTKVYTNWDIIYDWHVSGHDFPPYDSTKWATGYSVWPTTQLPPAGKNWVQPRDTASWKKPIVAVGSIPTRYDTMVNIWPADILPNVPILITKDIPDPIANINGFPSFVIPAGHSITPNGTITPNDLGPLPNGMPRNYTGNSIIKSEPNITLYKYVFQRIVIKDPVVKLQIKDSAAGGCTSETSIKLSFTRPDAFGLGKDGVEYTGRRVGGYGGDPQIVFDSTGYLTTQKIKKAPGVLPGIDRTFIRINYDSLLDRNDNTPCILDGFVDFDGGVTFGGTIMPYMRMYPGNPLLNSFTSPAGPRTYVNYFPNGFAPEGGSNMPFSKNGDVTIGLIVGNGCFSPTNCSVPGGISDTVWYHNFFRFVELDANFVIDNKNRATFPNEQFCTLTNRGDSVKFYYTNSNQQNVLADVWVWGDGTATIDSFYYAPNNIDNVISRKRFEMDALVFPWKINSMTTIPLTNIIRDTTINITYACEDIFKITPLKIDTIIKVTNKSFMLNPVWHVYTQTSAQMKIPDGKGNLFPAEDITPVIHYMSNNISGGKSAATKYIIIGVIDTFTTSNYSGELSNEFCLNETVYFKDSIRYWYPGQSCSRPLNYYENENDLFLFDRRNMFEWAYTKHNYPQDSINTKVTFDASNYIDYPTSVSVCPVNYGNRTLLNDNLGNPIARCYKNRTYFYERIYWDFESDGIIDAFGNNPQHKFSSVGTFKVSMISRDSTGNWDTCISYLNIKPYAPIDVLPDSTVLCKDFSTIALLNGGFNNITWSINGNIQPQLQGLYCFTADKEGLYSFQVKSNFGCTLGDQTYVYKMQKQPIIGPEIVNQNTAASYLVNNSTGHFYNWQIKGGSITGGQGTNMVNVQWNGADSSAWLKVTDSLNDCTILNNLDVIINGPISVNNIKVNNSFIIFPNPTSDKLYITSKYNQTGNFEIIVYSIEGKVIKQKQIKDFTTSQVIDVNDLSTGVYYLKISNQQSQYTYQFIKQ